MSYDGLATIETLNVGVINMGIFPPALQTLAGADTLALSGGQGSARVTAAAARTGFIIPPGTKHGQRLMLFIESAAANTVTAAAAGTSNIAGGVTVILSGLEAHEFIWNSVTALWYQIGPATQ